MQEQTIASYGKEPCSLERFVDIEEAWVADRVLLKGVLSSGETAAARHIGSILVAWLPKRLEQREEQKKLISSEPTKFTGIQLEFTNQVHCAWIIAPEGVNCHPPT